MVDPRAAGIGAVENAGAAIASGDGRAGPAYRIVAPHAGEPEVGDKVIEARLAAGACARRAQPIVEDIVAKIVVGAGPDFAADAGQSALLMSVEIVVNTELRVRSALQQRT